MGKTVEVFKFCYVVPTFWQWLTPPCLLLGSWTACTHDGQRSGLAGSAPGRHRSYHASSRWHVDCMSCIAFWAMEG